MNETLLVVVVPIAIILALKGASAFLNEHLERRRTKAKPARNVSDDIRTVLAHSEKLRALRETILGQNAFLAFAHNDLRGDAKDPVNAKVVGLVKHRSQMEMTHYLFAYLGLVDSMAEQSKLLVAEALRVAKLPKEAAPAADVKQP